MLQKSMAFTKVHKCNILNSKEKSLISMLSKVIEMERNKLLCYQEHILEIQELPQSGIVWAIPRKQTLSWLPWSVPSLSQSPVFANQCSLDHLHVPGLNQGWIFQVHLLAFLLIFCPPLLNSKFPSYTPLLKWFSSNIIFIKSLLCLII